MTIALYSTVLRRSVLRSENRILRRPYRRYPTSVFASMSGLNKETSDEKWKEFLSAQEYQVLRKKGTEAPGTGAYNKVFDEGVYKCAGCGSEIYKSETKFDSGCGWPAFYDEIPGSVEREVDDALGMRRTEIMCANCGGHLGHVFEGEGFNTPTNARHCVNSVSLKFLKTESKTD